MKQFIKNYLAFSKQERNGILVLLTIIVCIIIYLNISHLFYHTETVDFTAFEKQIATLNKSDKVKSEKKSFRKKEEVVQSELFHFNPNSLPEKGWSRLGLSDKQIKVIQNYKAKGGNFKQKSDFKKMYCISDKQYIKLEPYILIPSKQNKVLVRKKEQIEIKIVELNIVDSTELVALRGIGPFYAKSIVKYRSELGGFLNKQQLLELWKFDEKKLETISPQISIDPEKIKKININTCVAKELKHPYLNWKQVNAIINYRKHHGKFNFVEDIKKTDLINDLTFDKVSPYLTTK